MGKTETIKDRAVYVYLSSIDQKKRWKELAEKNDQSLSKFIVHMVEESLDKTSGEFESRADLIERIEELEEEVAELRKDRERKQKLVEKLEGELEKYRTDAFLEEDFEGIRKFSEDLVEILKEEKGPVKQGRLLSLLGISPAKKPDEVEKVAKQLEALQEYGLVESGPKGWRWTG